MVRIIISLGGTMTDSYPFAVFDGEFKGKRVLVTGGTKGIGEFSGLVCVCSSPLEAASAAAAKSMI